MTIIPVNLPQAPKFYTVDIAIENLVKIGSALQDLAKLGRKVLLVSNPQIAKLYGQQVKTSLAEKGFDVSEHLIPAGESYKTLASIERIYDQALASHLERSSTILALGGGVVGDMAGFAAATWKRGLNFVQVPTSLLAMVDASIGGKTGANHPLGKNLIGAFYQPRVVWIDPTVLCSLPPREFRAGMAEVIKYGMIWDRELFQQLESTASPLTDPRTIDSELLSYILVRSCQSKVDVVTQDETEQGLRAILNYGHTVGHAIESLTGYGKLVHGEAVALGMVAIAEIAVRSGLLTSEVNQRQRALIEKCGLPTQIPAELEVEAIMGAMQHDKKVQAGKIKFIVPRDIGCVDQSDTLDPEIIRVTLQDLQQSPVLSA
ncbi:MAG: 3-dehydroquinate synthase [Cyanobacteria bacterium P01_H01_bin.15]